MPSKYTKKNGTRNGVQRYIPDLKHYLYNIDTLWLNVGSHWYDDVMDFGLRDTLIAGRSARQDDGDIETVVECKLEGYENPIRFEVMSGNPPLYQYSIRNDSMAVYFAKSDRKNGQLPMRLELNQFLLWEKGVEGAYFEGISVLKALGFMPDEVRLNRVDFAVHSDQFEWTLADMATFDYPRNIKDDNEPNYYKLNAVTGRFGTMMQGDRSRLAIRIYNKSKEIEDKKKYYFYELYERNGIDPDKVWNIEIECRRPFLNHLCGLAEDEQASQDEVEDGQAGEEIKNKQQLKKMFDDFNYCLVNDGLSKLWTLLLEKYSHDSAHWRMLSKFDKHFAFQKVHGLTVEKDIKSDFDKEIPQILGRLSTAVLTEKNITLEHAIQILYKKIPEYEDKLRAKGKKIVTFEERVNDKKSKINNEDINSTIRKTVDDLLDEEKQQRDEMYLHRLLNTHAKAQKKSAIKK